VLIFDLDHFKETNDRFGHAFGDRVLKLFAATASAHLNGGSIVARLGGEEFAAILPGADPLEAAGAAEAVRRAFPSPQPSSTACRSVPPSAPAPRPWPRSTAISTRCSAGPTPRSMWRSMPGATGSSCWCRKMEALWQRSTRR
jgi:GGDEF domain-containing protein